MLSVAVLAIGSQHAANAGTCKTLMDNDSTLVKALAFGYLEDLPEFPFDAVFADLHNAAPWFSTCLAAIDPMTFYASMAISSNFRSCLRTAEQNNLDDGLWSPDGWEALCPLLENTAVPCVKNAMIEVVMDAFSLTGGCCDAFLAQVEGSFSDSLSIMVEKLSQYAVNIACSERKYTNLKGEASTELCGYSILKSLDFIESEDDALPMLGLMQLPNSEMCDAFAGEAVKLTNGSDLKIGFGTNGANSMGICLEPIDDLLQYVASWPLLAKAWDANGVAFSPSDLFSSGKALSFATLKSWFLTPTNLPAIWQTTSERFSEAERAFLAARYGYTGDGGGNYYDQPYHDSGSSTGEVGSGYDYGFSGSGNYRDGDGYVADYNYSYADYSYSSSYSSYWAGSSWGSESYGGESLLFKLIEELLADVDSMKFHVPNGGGCTYSSQSITLPYDVSKTAVVGTVASSATNSPTTTSTSTQSSGASSISTAVVSIAWIVGGLISSIL